MSPWSTGSGEAPNPARSVSQTCLTWKSLLACPVPTTLVALAVTFHSPGASERPKVRVPCHFCLPPASSTFLASTSSVEPFGRFSVKPPLVAPSTRKLKVTALPSLLSTTTGLGPTSTEETSGAASLPADADADGVTRARAPAPMAIATTTARMRFNTGCPFFPLL